VTRKELQDKVNEPNKWFELTVGRELRMVELKKELESLKKEVERTEELRKQKKKKEK